MMRSLPLAALAVLCLAGSGLAGPAWAVDSGLEVQVNPVSATGREMLLYPGGQYMRVVPVLREPGDTGAPIRLHMPTTRRARVASAAPPATPRAEAPARVERPAPPPRVASAAPKPAPKPPERSAPPPSAPPPPATYEGGPGAASLFGSLPTVSATPNTKLASAAPPKEAPAGTEGLAKQGQIFFAHDADTPAESSLDSIRLLAGQLNNALTRSQSRVELMAYGGPKGDKGSDARRLSLKRALAIRQSLIDSGVSSARIDVHAQGGVDDTGPMDRVDVFIRS
jgi:outer membrane protein OmpA-like peptidoglycan-associated protein